MKKTSRNGLISGLGFRVWGVAIIALGVLEGHSKIPERPGCVLDSDPKGSMQRYVVYT